MIWAKVRNGIVVDVMVADQDFINNFIDNSAGTWIETKEDGSIRKNYAGIGYTYNEENDVFIPPQPYQSWILNTETYRWESPIAYPSDNNLYAWNEETQQWVLIDG